MPYYTAELHYIGPMIAFVVDDVDNHGDDNHGENAENV